jgi:ABC-type branched-subunit amino acid transport system substrate-binding protein
LVAVAAAAAVVAALATTGVAEARTSAVRGVTSTSITVAGLTDNQQPEAADGAKAYFASVNAAGGIFGRKINYLGGNIDNGDATQDLTLGKQLVQQNQVFAVVPVVSPVSTGSVQYFQQQQVPFFGWGIAQGFCSNLYGFGFTGCIVPPPPVTVAGSTWGDLVSKNFQRLGKGTAKGKAAAVIAEDGDSGRTGVTVISASAKSAGMNVVYSKAALPAPPAVPSDYSPYVNAMLTSNNGKAPDAIFLVVQFSNVLGLAKALQQSNYQGVITNAVGYVPALTSAPSIKGQEGFTQFATPESAPNNPNMATIVSTIKKGLGNSVTISQGMLSGYFSADFFVKALKKAGKNLTPQTLAKAANSLTYQISGVVGPTPYPTAQKYGTPCGSLVRSDGSTWQIDVPYACFTNITISTLKPIPQK